MAHMTPVIEMDKSAVKVLDPVQKVPLSRLVAERIREGILKGSIRPGQGLTEEDLAQMLGVSRSPVRQALVQLEYEGLIRRDQNQVATVVTMSAGDIEEVCSFRLALEALAIRYAINRTRPEELEVLDRILRQHSECARSGEALVRLVELDLAFHEQLVRMSGHTRVMAAWQSIKYQISFLMFTCDIVSHEEFPSLMETWHLEIVEGIRRKDLAWCARHLQMHLENAHTMLSHRHTDRTKRQAEGQEV